MAAFRMHKLSLAPGEGGQCLDEVIVDVAAVRAGQAIAVIAEVVEALLGQDDQLVTIIALETIQAARIRREDVVRVHGAQDERSALPALQAEVAAEERETNAAESLAAEAMRVGLAECERLRHKLAAAERERDEAQAYVSKVFGVRWSYRPDLWSGPVLNFTTSVSVVALQHAIDDRRDLLRQLVDRDVEELYKHFNRAYRGVP